MPTRDDGKPFVKDSRGAIPKFVVEDDDEGVAILINQFTLESEVIGERPIPHYDLRLITAHKKLLNKDRNHATRTPR